MNAVRYVQVFTANGQLEGQIIKLYLEAGGVDVQASQESAGVVHGFTIGRLGEVKILVPEEQEQTALDLLAAMEPGAGEDSSKAPEENSTASES